MLKCDLQLEKVLFASFLGFSTFAISRTSSLAILSCLVGRYKLDDKDEQQPSTYVEDGFFLIFTQSAF